MKTKILVYIVFSPMILVGGVSCKRKLVVDVENHNGANADQRLPVEVAVVRDGETTMIKLNDLPNGESKEFYFARVKDPEIKGQIYSRVDWRSSSTPPFSIEEALAAMNQIEGSIRRHYGDDLLKKIIEDRDKLNNLSQEEMLRYMQDPILNDQLDAHFALDMIREYRQYFKERL